MWKKWIDLLLGDTEETGLENRFSHLVLLLVIITLFIATLINLFLELGPFLTWLTFLGIPLMLFIYWISRVRRKYLAGKWVMTVALFVMLDMLWYHNSASEGPILYVFIVFYTVLFLVWQGLIRMILVGMFFLNLIALAWVEYHYAHEIIRYATEEQRVIDVYSALAIYSLLATFLVNAVKDLFVREREKARRSDRLKSAFLANMSHEIRTPMNSILGFSQLLAEPVTEEEKTQYVRIINDNSIYLLQLIEDIIDISKIEAEQIEIFPVELKLQELFEEIKLVFLQSLIKNEKSHIALEYKIPSPHLRVHADKIRLKQVLSNLLTNAVKFTDNGRIEFGCHIREKELEFYTCDSGIGISPRHQKEIFERFFKVEDKHPDRIYRGTGIGLAISKNLVELMGGKMWVESEPGKGSCFRFTLPYEPVEEPERPDRSVQRMAGEFHWNGHTILIAEDEESNYLYLHEVLKKTGISILRATHGQEAVDTVSDHPEIDLVLMDIKMPGIDGYQATRKVKALRKDLPVIAQTAYAMEGDAARSLEAGCDDYLPKPIKPDVLLQKMAEYLE
ncbi:MAG: ATP-binding protein [Bacteroidales bacterium]